MALWSLDKLMLGYMDEQELELLLKLAAKYGLINSTGVVVGKGAFESVIELELGELHGPMEALKAKYQALEVSAACLLPGCG